MKHWRCNHPHAKKSKDGCHHFQKIQIQIQWLRLCSCSSSTSFRVHGQGFDQEKMDENVVASTAIITAYAKEYGLVHQAFELFNKIPPSQRDTVSWNAMIAGFVHSDQMEMAMDLFRKTPHRNVVTWTTLISGYVQNGCFKEALQLYSHMNSEGTQPNHFTLASVLPASYNLNVLEAFHQQIVARGFQSNVFVGNRLIVMYAKFGRSEIARQVFDKMAHRNVVTWTAMVTGYMQNGLVDDALDLFWRMPQRNVISWNALLTGYVHNGLLNNAYTLFQEMPQRNLASWNAMIAGFVCNKRIDEAMKLFKEMPNRDIISWNIIIAGYAQSGHTDEALKLFREMPKKSLVSWNSIIAGHAQNGLNQEALRLFKEMRMAGMKPNSQTFTVVLPLYANLAALRQGKEIHDNIIRMGYQSDVFVGSALVDMYAKCGSIENAHSVFDEIHHQDVVSWSTMIIGYAMHGYSKEALQLFQQMHEQGIKPDHVTFVGVLSACAQAGLVNEGWHYFRCMSEHSDITPTMEHYGCMVDLLGRTGQLNEALHFINTMPINADATVLACLLGYCRIHNNMEVGESVAMELIQLDPENPAPYVQLSNVYAALGRWDRLGRVRKLMKHMRLPKKPGCSWIEINRQLHVFLVADTLYTPMD